MVLPAHLSPFVLPIETRAAVRHGAVDLYLPEADEARPAIVFIHGWVSKEQEPPRTWPLFQGYGSLAASRGVVGVTVDHRLYGPTGYQLAAADVAAAIGSMGSTASITPTSPARPSNAPSTRCWPLRPDPRLRADEYGTRRSIEMVGQSGPEEFE